MVAQVHFKHLSNEDFLSFSFEHGSNSEARPLQHDYPSHLKSPLDRNGAVPLYKKGIGHLESVKSRDCLMSAFCIPG